MRDPFTSSSGGAQLRGFVGRLGLFTPQDFIPAAVQGKFGPADGIRTDLVLLDDGEDEPLEPAEAETLNGMLVLNGPVINELKTKLEPIVDANGKTTGWRPVRRGPNMHLGRIKAIENKKGGQNDVIVLDPPTDSDKDLARAFLAYQATPAEDPFGD